jgi:serine/threonine-protein kinase
MRFVRGRTLSEAIRSYHEDRQANRAGALDRLTLLNAFVGVCNAVAYAHSRDVIHRDLKGQNVVLGDFGEVMVLDWGLAKLVDRPDAAATLSPPVAVAPDEGRDATCVGQALGTPAYMAPEQAEGRIDQVDLCTDVYGLGAILYEILTGEPPFVGDDVADVLRRVVQEPPRRPRLLDPSAPAALEAVCLKALEKAPERRYTRVKDLARDVQRFLADEPVSVYRDPLAVRLARWGRRHRTATVGIGALLLAAVVGLSIGTMLINRERARAEASFRQARQAVDESFTIVSESKLLDVPGLQPLRKQLLDSARRYYQGFLRQRGEDRGVRADLAASHYRLAMITRLIGPRDEALGAFGQAVSLYERLVREHPQVARYRTDLAICYNDLGNLLRALGRPDDALTTHRKAVALREELVRAHSGRPRYHDELTRSYANIESLLDELGKTSEALKSHQRALAISEAIVQSDPSDLEFPTDLGRHYSTLPGLRYSLSGRHEATGALLAKLGRYDEAMTHLDRARTLLVRLSAEQPTDFDYRSSLASCLLTLGYWQAKLGRPDDAQAGYDQALAIVERLAAENPEVTGFRSQLAVTYQYLGRLKRDQGRLDEAVDLYHRARAIQEALILDHPELVGLHSALAYTFRGLGRTLGDRGERDAALAAFEKARHRCSVRRDVSAVTLRPGVRPRSRVEPHRSGRAAEGRRPRDGGLAAGGRERLQQSGGYPHRPGPQRPARSG